MKRITMVVIAAVAFSALGVSFAVAVGIPEVDRANATFVLDPIGKFKKVNCPGEDGINYRTLRGRWEGGENEVTPGFTDYDLSGPLTVSKVVWTINLVTGRGVLKANILLRDAVTLIRTYSGTLTLITHGIPDPNGADVIARGWIVAKTYGGDPPNPPGAPDGGSLLANVEVQIDGNMNAKGEFGDAAPNPGFPDFSATTINQAC
jgi:hypothetical protein